VRFNGPVSLGNMGPMYGGLQYKSSSHLLLVLQHAVKALQCTDTYDFCSGGSTPRA